MRITIHTLTVEGPDGLDDDTASAAVDVVDGLVEKAVGALQSALTEELGEGWTATVAL